MPSIIPDQEGPLYFVLCDYGPKIGKAYYEADPDKEWLLRGEFENPQRVIEVDSPPGPIAS